MSKSWSIQGLVEASAQQCERISVYNVIDVIKNSGTSPKNCPTRFQVKHYLKLLGYMPRHNGEWSRGD